MAKNDLDMELVLILPFSLGAAASLGIVEATFLPILDLGEVLIESGNIELTLGRIISVLSLLAVLVHRDASLTETSGADAWIVYATIGMLVAPPLFPSFESTLAAQPAGFIAFTVQTTGFFLVSYIN